MPFSSSQAFMNQNTAKNA